MTDWSKVTSFAQDTRKKLKERGKRQGKRHCPFCGGQGTVSVILAGKKDHLHMSCSTKDCLRYME